MPRTTPIAALLALVGACTTLGDEPSHDPEEVIWVPAAADAAPDHRLAWLGTPIGPVSWPDAWDICYELTLGEEGAGGDAGPAPGASNGVYDEWRIPTRAELETLRGSTHPHELGEASEYWVTDTPSWPLQGERMVLCIHGTPPQRPEICLNGIDDDRDGLVDCGDPDCFGASICDANGSCDPRRLDETDRAAATESGTCRCVTSCNQMYVPGDDPNDVAQRDYVYCHTETGVCAPECHINSDCEAVDPEAVCEYFVEKDRRECVFP